jgi:hypothetical protein
VRTVVVILALGQVPVELLPLSTFNIISEILNTRRNFLRSSEEMTNFLKRSTSQQIMRFREITILEYHPNEPSYTPLLPPTTKVHQIKIKFGHNSRPPSSAMYSIASSITTYS